MQHCEKIEKKELITFFKLMRENFDISSLDLSKAVDEYKVNSN